MKDFPAAAPKPSAKTRKRRKIPLWLYAIAAVALMVSGHIFFSLVPHQRIAGFTDALLAQLDASVLLFMLGGFIAQMIDGALGMAYGVSVTTFLLGLGIPAITPAVASASMHAAEVVTTGTSSLIYMRYKNVNWKLFRILLLPGALGAVLGAATISWIGKDAVFYVKPLIALYTLTLGILIIRKAYNFHLKTRSRIRQFGAVALGGGFFDSVGGGGWGPIVTTTLVAAGRDFRYAVGSSHVAKFFVATISTISFIAFIGLSHWKIIFGLIVGSLIAAPVSIYLSTRIPRKKALVLVGLVVVIVSLRTIILTFA